LARDHHGASPWHHRDKRNDQARCTCSTGPRAGSHLGASRTVAEELARL